jgi:multisubunit Na+/H+ antiporter MnhB subunit
VPGILVDLSLAALTLWVAWRALSHDDLFVSVMLFIVFGLLMSLLWVLLGAEDIALAEAAIGAGLTGALLLDAVPEFDSPRGRGGAVDSAAPAVKPPSRGQAIGVTLLTTALGAFLALVVVRLAATSGGLTAHVTEQLGRSGVAQPVTAVLVNFRGYDTMLEMGVLLVAGLGMLTVRRAHDLSGVPNARERGDLIIGWLTRLLLPILVLTGMHLLLLGTHRAGGAFQAGAVLASAAILLLLAGHRSVDAIRGIWFRVVLLLGFVVFLSTAIGLMLAGGKLLEFSSSTTSGLILLIEAAVAVSTGFTLTALFVGASPPPAGPAGRTDASAERANA